MIRQSPSSRAFTFALCVVAALSTLLVCVVFAPARASAAEACPNESLRTGLSAQLPECRVYEMVSPVYKGGYSAAGIRAVAPDGESLAFQSFGAFAGLPWIGVSNAYVARRGATGWSTTGLESPPEGSGPVDFSSTLEYELSNSEQTKPGELDHYLLHRTDTPDTAANFEVFGFGLKALEGLTQAVEEGASTDLCHLVLEDGIGPLLPESGTERVEKLYDFARGCGGGEPSLRPIAVKNTLGEHGEPELISQRCGPNLGVGSKQVGSPPEGEETDAFNSVSAGGRELFFSTSVDGTRTSCPNESQPQLFVRLDGARTLEVSKPVSEASVCGEAIPCPGAATRAPAFFKGASEEGSRVFFTTRAPLVGEDKDSGNDLYMATIGCPVGEPECEVAKREVTSLTQISHDRAAGEAAEVQGVVKLAQDGSRIYFVAHGVLGEGANPEGQAPAAGADNLYVYEPDPEHEGQDRTVFVADLCSGPGVSGKAQDVRCPANLESVAERNDDALWTVGSKAQSTADGGFLVFSTYGQLSRGDTDTARDIYRYDAETGLLNRVSIGEDGADANGNNSAFDATLGDNGSTSAFVIDQYEMNDRAISKDGSRIAFTTAEPLSERATNGLGNVYEWYEEPGETEGKVALISSGSSPTADDRISPVITPSGRDIFFTTAAGLVPQDTDGETDVYDARVDGGFPPAPAEPRECSGDACQGPLTNPAPLLVPGSVSQTSGDNFSPIVSPPASKTRSKATKCGKGYVKRKNKCVKKLKAGKVKRRAGR